MTSLVALLSTGKGTWAEVAKILKAHEWDKMYLVTNDFGARTFNRLPNMEFVLINPDEPMEKIIEEITKSLKEKIKDTEVALNFSSGTGKEHMALLSSMLKLGLGIRLVTMSEDKLTEI